MSDIPIKFRGVDVFSKKLVYGDYLSPTDSTTLSTFGLPQIINKKGIHFVTSNSVAQLAGYDDNRKNFIVVMWLWIMMESSLLLKNGLWL